MVAKRKVSQILHQGSLTNIGNDDKISELMSINTVGVMSKSNQTENIKSHIQGIDGLRGIAILMVIGYHLFPNVMPGGFIGVNLFLVLSGFLTVVSSCKRLKNNRYSIIGFYIDRLIRLFPALILTIAITVIACYIFVPDALRGIRMEIASVVGGFNNWWQIAESGSYFTDIASSSPFVHLWYLSLEMQFYLLWPILFYLVNWLRKKGFRGELVFILFALVSIAASILMVSPQVDPTRAYYGLDSRLYAFCIGAFVGYNYVYRRNRIMNDPIPIMIGFITLLVMTLASVLFIDASNIWTYWVILPLSAIGFAILCDIASNTRYVFGLWVDNPVLKWFNQYSYVFYLTHYPIIYIVTRVYGNLDFIGILICIFLLIVFTIWISLFDLLVRQMIKGWMKA